MVRLNMNFRDQWDNRNTLLNYLADQLAWGRLAIILGAGTSISLGLPNWPTLVKRLFEKASEPVPDESNLELLAEHFRRTFFGNDHEGYVSAIHDALYKGVDVSFEALMKGSTLAAIGSLVMASHRGSAAEVVTFNFDNLLELFLAYHGFVTYAVTEGHQWATRSDVTVHHPHGFIPHDLSAGFSDQIIFDQISYDKVIGDAKHPWRQRILTLMRTHTCLFIGLSGRDGNLGNLLHECNNLHASSSEHSAFWGLTFTTSDNVVLKGFWEERGVFSHRLSDYGTELPAFLFEICQISAANKMRVL